LSLGRKSGGFVDVRYWGFVCGDEAMGWRRERGEGRGERRGEREGKQRRMNE
jgi:hypothetical protein